MNVSKNDLLRWVQMMGRGMIPFGDLSTASKVYSNYNVWELGVMEATKSLVKKYKKKGIEITRDVKNGKKTVVVEFPDELKDEILEQLLPEHITLEEIKERLVRKVRDILKRKKQEKMVEDTYYDALALFEAHKDSNDDLKKRFTYWYYFNLGIYVEDDAQK